MRFLGWVLCGLWAFGAGGAAVAAECADKLAVSRTISYQVSDGPVGKLNYPKTLNLQPREVVLTFDDGPVPENTPAVLAALKAQCVQATFFVVGEMVAANPDILRQIVAEHHTIGTHTWSHRYLPRISSGREDQISGGFLAAAKVLEGDRTALSPFFRFPGLERTKKLEAYVQTSGLVPFSVDVVGDDWKRISPDEVLRRTLSRLEENNGGIILLHDIQKRTVEMLPRLLEVLKTRGFRVVHVTPTPGETQSALILMNIPENPRILNALARIAPSPVVAGLPASAGQIARNDGGETLAMAGLDLQALGLRGSMDSDFSDWAVRR